ncbi:unnamed protein product [Sphagnum balticum]
MGSVRCSAVCSLVARTPEGGGVCGPGSCLHLLAGAGTQSRCGKSSLRDGTDLDAEKEGRAADLDAAKEDSVHCASCIDAVWERKHQTVAGSGRGSPLRQLARRSCDLTLVHQQMGDVAEQSVGNTKATFSSDAARQGRQTIVQQKEEAKER